MTEIAHHHRPAPRWLTEARDYDFDGFEIIGWPQLRAGPMATLRDTPMQRGSLANPVQPWLDRLDATPRLAIHDVYLDGPAAAAADLLGFVVEPAPRRGIELLIDARQRLEALSDADFIEPRFGYAYSLGRLRWALRAAPPPHAAPESLLEIDRLPQRRTAPRQLHLGVSYPRPRYRPRQISTPTSRSSVRRPASSPGSPCPRPSLAPPSRSPAARPRPM